MWIGAIRMHGSQVRILPSAPVSELCSHACSHAGRLSNRRLCSLDDLWMQVVDATMRMDSEWCMTISRLYLRNAIISLRRGFILDAMRYLRLAVLHRNQ